MGDGALHPAQLVVDLLGGPDDENRKLHCRQLEAWYQEYASGRGLAFKKPGFVSCWRDFIKRKVCMSTQRFRFIIILDGLAV